MPRLRTSLLPALLLTLGTVTACSTKVPIEDPEVSATDAAACRALVQDLPDTLAGELRRSVDPDDALGAAWGDDPPYVLTCGVPEPDDVPDDATCVDFGHGMGWYVPDQQTGDLRIAAVATTLTHTPRVSLEIPAERRQRGVDSALSELGRTLARHLTVHQKCL